MKSDEVDWNEVYRTNYRSRAFWDIHWFRTAEALIASAKELEPKVKEVWESYRAQHSEENDVPRLADHFQRPYFMLIAYAIENLFKGQIVRESATELKASFDHDGKFPHQLKGHKLVELAEKVEFPLDQGKEDLLRRLTRSAIWAGRYPTPLDYKDTSGVECFSDGQKFSVSWFGGNDIARLNELIEHIYDHFDIRRPQK